MRSFVIRVAKDINGGSCFTKIYLLYSQIISISKYLSGVQSDLYI